MVYKSPLSQKNIIEVRNLSLTYSGMSVPSLIIDQLTVQRGECVALCGASGSGKSSFLKLLNGLIPEYYSANIKGEVRLWGRSLGKLNLEDLSYDVASVFQNPATQFFHQQVLHELVFSCENQGLSSEEIQERLNKVVASFRLRKLLGQSLFDLSGGQKQQIALASATMQGTDIILLDEPTANLDQQSVQSLRTLLNTLKKQGKTLLIAEHHLAYLDGLADRYLYFKNGRLTIDCLAQEFFSKTETFRKEMGLRSYRFDSFHRTNRDLHQVFSDDVSGLVVEHLNVQQGGKNVCQIERLCLTAGKVIGLTGPNGSGKTSFASYLAGLKDDKGSSFVWRGHRLSARERLSKTAFVMQEVGLQLFTESVRKELLLGKQTTCLDLELLNRFQLTNLLDRHPASLSGGEQQRVLLVANLLLDKDFFILDEPTSGLDLQQMQEVAHSLSDLKQAGKVVLLISHDEELLATACDQILSMEDISKNHHQ